MASRVERYYNKQDAVTKRSQKNQDLYDAISELDKKAENDLAKLYSLFQDFDNQKSPLDDLYLEKSNREETREHLYSFLDDAYYDPFDLMVQKEYDQTVAQQYKIEELVDTLTDHLDILDKQESHLKDLKDVTFQDPVAKDYSSKSSLPDGKRRMDVSDISSKAKSLLSSKKITSHLLKDEKEEERSFNLKVKKIVLFLFILNFIFLLFFFYHSIS